MKIALNMKSKELSEEKLIKINSDNDYPMTTFSKDNLDDFFHNDVILNKPQNKMAFSSTNVKNWLNEAFLPTLNAQYNSFISKAVISKNNEGNLIRWNTYQVMLSLLNKLNKTSKNAHLLNLFPIFKTTVFNFSYPLKTNITKIIKQIVEFTAQQQIMLDEPNLLILLCNIKYIDIAQRLIELNSLIKETKEGVDDNG